MGWARTLLLGDIGNRLDIADTEQDISGIHRELATKRHLDESQDDAIRRVRAGVAPIRRRARRVM